MPTSIGWPAVEELPHAFEKDTKNGVDGSKLP
jgi:hypothetical protein